jgi:nucleoside-diphosphate-sugar epimerase
MTAPLLILGCGYVGTRIAKAALAQGRHVRVGARGTGRLQPLQALGAEVKYLDAAVPKHVTAIFSGMSGATVVYSIPPITNLPPGVNMRNTLQAAYGVGANSFIYFSSSGLYGDLPDDETWIDDDTPTTHDDPGMSNIQSDELEIERSEWKLRTITLRLAPVYGPGRGVRERIRKGTYKLLDDGSHVTSRIHVDDVVQIVFAAEERGTPKSRYLVADDQPTTQREYAEWLCERMGAPMPPSRAIFEPGAPKAAHRNRKIRNARMKADLGVTLKYPSFKEGELQIEEETGARG